MNTNMNTSVQIKDTVTAYEAFREIIKDIPSCIEQLKENEDARQKNMEHPYIIRTIFSDHPECWDNKHGASLSKEQEKAAWCIANCKTRNMNGFTAGVCPGCGYTVLHYKSCGNRNCPSCQLPMQMQWIEERKKEVIPGQPYFHIILTCDHRLNPLFQYNQKLLVGLYHSCASSAIIDLCRDPHYLGAVPGIISVLHSWKQDLLPHWHLHCVVSGCGLTDTNQFVSILDSRKPRRTGSVPEETQWNELAEACVDDDDEDEIQDAENTVYFLPMEALTNLFRNKFMDGLRKLWAKKELIIPESHPEWKDFIIWSDFCRSVSTTKWVGKLVKAFHGKGKTNAIEYLARYVFRTAISNSRITDYDGKHVTFRVRDNHNPGQHMECRLSAEEFIRRLLSHVLDSRVTRVRYSGFLNCARRRKNLCLIAKLLKHEQMLKFWSDEPPQVQDSDRRQDADEKLSMSEMMASFFQKDICNCPHCKSPLILWPPRPLHETKSNPSVPKPVLPQQLEQAARYRAKILTEEGRKAWDKIMKMRESNPEETT